MNQATLANQSIFLENLINWSKGYKNQNSSNYVGLKRDFKAEERSVEGLNRGLSMTISF